MSNLPVISQPTFAVTIPSTKEVIHFRPFVVREEKILLIAQEGDTSDIIRAIKKVLESCIEETIDFNKLTTFDLEYLFLKLRAKSVNNIAKVSYQDNDDGKIRDFEIDLDSIEVLFDPTNEKRISIQDGVGLEMRYPTADITDKIVEFENEADMLMFFISNSIDSVYDNETVYPASDYTEEEIQTFLESLDVNTFEKIKNFFQSLPRLYHKIEYVNDNEKPITIEFNNLRDFFMWG